MVDILKWPKKIISNIIRRRLDKMGKNTYVYYSGPTDDTGKRLAEALNAKHGKVKPTSKESMIVIGWGCKTKDRVDLKQHTVLNHPDRIRNNRNKLGTLMVLKDAKVPVADYIDAGGVIAALNNPKVAINIPLVGRRKYHQGGKGFWMCLTKGQVELAIKQGAEYFQNYLPIVDEYRLHVFKDGIFNMQKKTERSNMASAFKEQHGNRIANIAGKNKVNLDKQTMDYVLENLGKREEHPDQIVKSNSRGWKFSQIKSAPADLRQAAIAAVKAIGLDFGAVDCCVTEDKKVYIIEVNSGPGLQGTPFDAYVTTFKEQIALINKPAPKKSVVAGVNKAETTAKVSAAGAAVASDGSVKQGLVAKAALMSEMIANADEDEAAALQNVIKKMWG